MANIMNYSKTGAKREAAIKLDKAVFGLEPNHLLVDQAYRAYLANGRTPVAKTLTRGEVRGGGRKPWRQKGTGRARVGSIRVPNWKGGGVVFGATGNENYTITMPVKAKRLAIRQSLSAQAAEGRISVIENLVSTDGKVTSMMKLLAKLSLEGRVVIVVGEMTDMISRATRNIAAIEVIEAKYLNVFTILNADRLLFTDDALKVVSAWLGDAEAEKPVKTEKTEEVA